MTDFELKQKFPNMTLVKSPPTLISVNGCGVSMYGSRDYDSETKTYVSTWCLSLVLIPLFGLRAYRVMKAPNGGWYFIGREPLSTFVKAWNLLLILGILSAIGGVQYNNYTSSPGYRAKVQMARAKTLSDQGKLTDAARTYQTLINADTPQAANAVVALKGLLDGPCQQASLGESAGVVALATQVARRGSSLALAEVIETANKLVAAKGDADPPNAVVMLDTVRPLVIDTRPIDDRRLVLLEKWVAKEPNNVDAIVALASILEKKNRLDDAKKILLPIKDQLGDGEGARVLGLILSRQGDEEGAYALLWPYTKSRLDSLHTAEQGFDSAIKSLWDREIKLLKENKAPADFYEKYKNAGANQQDAMVQDYVNGRIKNDPLYTQTQETLEQQAAVVPVALELGMVMLQRAQGQTDPAVRQEQLTSTEQVFLAVGGVAGQSDVYRLSLGQVYYWLGKQAEGRKLFDEYLVAKGRGYGDLMAIGNKLRQLGSDPEARALMEEAYNKTSVQSDKEQAAASISVMAIDLDDEIAWLNKSDTEATQIKARLASTLGSKAFQQGNDAEAAKQYQAAIDLYASMPRSSSVLNQTALAYFAIYQTTGERQAFDRSFDYFQQAVSLDPSNSILLYNAGSTILSGALSDIVGTDIDLRLLHQSGTVSMLGYLYRDAVSREALMNRVKAHPGIARGMSFLEKVMVLSPKNARSYEDVMSIYRFTRDDSAMKLIEKRIAVADLDTRDEVASTKKFLDGTKDQTNKETIQSSIKRGEALLKAARAKGGYTAAVALDVVVSQMMTLAILDDTVDLDKAIALADEAYKLAPSPSTQSLLMAAYSAHATKALRASDPAFDAYYRKYCRSLGASYTLAIAADTSNPFSAKILASPDVQKIAELLKVEANRFPDSRGVYEWAMLKPLDSEEAKKAADTIRNTPRMLTEQAISQRLRPASAAEAIETYWLMQVHGRSDEAKAALQSVVSLGIPVPIQP